MKILKGQNIDFSTKTISSKKVSQSSKRSEKYDNPSGDFVDFNITTIKKDKLDKKAQLQGSSVTFSIAKTTTWSWAEKKPSVCMICKLPLKAGQDIARCPMCHSPFHGEHIFEWLKVKGKCPVCLQNLRPGATEEVKL